MLKLYVSNMGSFFCGTKLKIYFFFQELNYFNIYIELSWDYLFIPVGIETFGSWGDMGHKLIKDIGKKLKEVSGELRSTFYLTQKISVALQRGNASCVLGTAPFTKGLESIFEFESHEKFVSDLW